MLDWRQVGYLGEGYIFVSATKHIRRGVTYDNAYSLASRAIGHSAGRLPTIDEAKFIFRDIEAKRYLKDVEPIWTSTPIGSSRYIYSPTRGPVIAATNEFHSCLSVLIV